MNAYRDGWWKTDDGLRLHYRDYPCDSDRPPLICLPGLTRNARDFAGLAEHLGGRWRVICPEMRGRGASEYAQDWRSYHPLQYVHDVAALCAQAGIARFAAIGTSLGGLMTLVLATMDTGRIAGAVLNDIGPVLEPAGLARIAGHVGQAREFADWPPAAAALAQTQGVAFPDHGDADWLAMARRLMSRGDDGLIRFDYDMRIGRALGEAGPSPAPDLWPGIAALADRPVLLLRGELSDLLSPQTFAEMGRRLPGAEAVSVPRVGHAPTLDEPAAREAIGRWLSRLG